MKHIGFHDVRLGDEILTSTSGLALMGLLLRRSGLAQALDQAEGPGRAERISAGAIATSLCGLISLGHLDYERIEPLREDPAFGTALNLEKVPSAPTLRQRTEVISGATKGTEDETVVVAGESRCAQTEMVIRQSIARMQRTGDMCLTAVDLPTSGSMVPVDMDTTVMEELYGKKQGVGYTYQQVMGYAPMFTYIGSEGFIFDAELRPGVQHSQKGTVAAIDRARQHRDSFVSPTMRLLWRIDGGCDAADTLEALEKDERDAYIVVHNRRKETTDLWMRIARRRGERFDPRPGKSVWIGETRRMCGRLGYRRCVFRVTVRKTDAKGQHFIEPKIETRLFWTNLPDTPEAIIDCYANHGTSEQFHAEYKTDLNMEQFPSSDYNVNRVLLLLGCLVFNALRELGQQSLAIDGVEPAEQAPVRRRPLRRRLRSVIDDIIRIAGRVIHSGRRIVMSLGRSNPWAAVWLRLYRYLCAQVET